MKHSHPSIPLRISLLCGTLAVSLALLITAWALPMPDSSQTSAQAQVEVAVNAEKSAGQESSLVLRSTDGMVCVYRNGILFYKTDIPVVPAICFGDLAGTVGRAVILNQNLIHGIALL